MQTSQVTNPANLFTAVTSPGKQTDTGSSGQSFGQVLSREVADRQQTAQPAKAEAISAPRREPQAAAGSARASSTSSSSQAAGRPSSTEAKQPGKNKALGEKAEDKEIARELNGAAPQSPEELLAMVASMVHMTIAAPEDTSDKDVPQEASALVDPATLLAASGMVHTDQAILRTEKADVALSELQFGDAAPELEADGRGVSMKGLLLGHASALQPDAHENATTKLPPDLSEADAPAGGLEAIALKPQGIVLESESRPASSDFSAKLQDTMTQIPVLTQSIQQAAHAATRALEGKAADRLTPAVGSTGWDQALGQKVVWMVAGEQQSASLTLNPPDLGPLQVVLNVNNSQASATFTAAQPEVRQALEAALPKLRDMLNEAGIQLGQATVGSGSPNQQSQEGRSHTARHDSQGNSGNTDASGIATLQSGRTPLTSGSTGIVDTFV